MADIEFSGSLFVDTDDKQKTIVDKNGTKFVITYNEIGAYDRLTLFNKGEGVNDEGYLMVADLPWELIKRAKVRINGKPIDRDDYKKLSGSFIKLLNSEGILPKLSEGKEEELLTRE